MVDPMLIALIAALAPAACGAWGQGGPRRANDHRRSAPDVEGLRRAVPSRPQYDPQGGLDPAALDVYAPGRCANITLFG